MGPVIAAASVKSGLAALSEATPDLVLYLDHRVAGIDVARFNGRLYEKACHRGGGG